MKRFECPRSLISVAEAAAYLGCSAKTVRRRIAEGAIVAYRTPGHGRLIRVDRDQLEGSLIPMGSLN
ncbi:excisionase family DNA-binding protein [Demequina maris]|uniref:excisionase family DNA-binding protein n=1 Tax=Demequina maris TaxID=1638982 RepID=UPI0009E23431|nr:helix-turn-helix domain-containing protein [Demequina maris]